MTQDGPKMAPRSYKDGPTMPQEAPKMGPRGFQMRQDGPKMLQTPDYSRSTSLSHFYSFMGVLVTLSLFLLSVAAMQRKTQRLCHHQCRYALQRSTAQDPTPVPPPISPCHAAARSQQVTDVSQDVVKCSVRENDYLHEQCLKGIATINHMNNENTAKTPMKP